MRCLLDDLKCGCQSLRSISSQPLLRTALRYEERVKQIHTQLSHPLTGIFSESVSWKGYLTCTVTRLRWMSNTARKNGKGRVSKRCGSDSLKQD